MPEVQQGRGVTRLTDREQAKTPSLARAQLNKTWPSTLWVKKEPHTERDKLRGGLRGPTNLEAESNHRVI